ncbi:MAG TPA: sulfatase-like hydrolase/transferase [Thermoanaerobaculia bacterium]|nr:sulfatase-like hydrolase/transferase [Thermoanaerobaculia bacterium]
MFLISVDTLRSDHLPAYGYHGVDTPRLEGLRADSILYTHAYSHCPLTLPSHLTMLTGLLPADHGVRDNIGFKLAASIPTLGSLMKGNGYATGAAVSAFVLRRESGISRGFDFYDDEVEPVGPSQVIGRVQRDGRETVRVAENWIDQQTRPVFFFLHLYEPHTPYTPPEPYFSRYPNHYDGEIAYVDAIVGTFLDYLKRKNLYDDALIIFVSDHGEGLNEHGEEEHGIFLYREALQVPLFVKLPRAAHAGESTSTPVELIDVFRTIVEQTDTKPPQQHNDARSLLAMLDAGAPVRSVYSETFYPRFHFGWSDLHSLIDGQHHYIRAPIPELFDVVNDPAEKKNALEENRRVYTAMRAAIEPLVRQAAAPVNVDPEEARKLAALGYIGSTVQTGENEQLPDPKTTIGTFHDIRVAFTKYRNEKQEEALEITNRLLKDNPRILDLWDLKSNILMKLGRNEEAIAAAKEGLKQAPNAVQLMFGVANLSILTGELDQAQQHAELAMKWEPGQAHEILARVWADRRDYTRAEQEARLAMQTEHEPIGALLTLGLIEKQKGDLQKSLGYFDQARDLAGEKGHRRIPNLHYYRGDILARLGRNDEAEREFREEIALYPTQPDAYTALVLLLSSEQRLEEATKLIFRLIEVAPNPPSYIAVSETLKAIGDDRGSLYWAYQGLQKYPRNAPLKKLARG